MKKRNQAQQEWKGQSQDLVGSSAVWVLLQGVSASGRYSGVHRAKKGKIKSMTSSHAG